MAFLFSPSSPLLLAFHDLLAHPPQEKTKKDARNHFPRSPAVAFWENPPVFRDTVSTGTAALCIVSVVKSASIFEASKFSRTFLSCLGVTRYEKGLPTVSCKYRRCDSHEYG